MPKEIKELKTFDKGENSWADARDIPDGYSAKLEGLLPGDIGQLKTLPAFAQSPIYRANMDEYASHSYTSGQPGAPQLQNGDNGSNDEFDRWKAQVSRVHIDRPVGNNLESMSSQVGVMVCMIKEQAGQVAATPENGSAVDSPAGQNGIKGYRMKSTGSPGFTSRHVGNLIINKTDDTFSYIIGVIDATRLVIQDNIFDNNDYWYIPGFGQRNQLRSDDGADFIVEDEYDVRLKDMKSSGHYSIRIQSITAAADTGQDLVKFKVAKGLGGDSTSYYYTPKEVYDGFIEGHTMNWRPEVLSSDAATFNAGIFGSGEDGAYQETFDYKMHGVNIHPKLPAATADCGPSKIGSMASENTDIPDGFVSDIYKIDEGVYIRFFCMNPKTTNSSSGGLHAYVKEGDRWYFEIEAPMQWSDTGCQRGSGIGSGSMDRTLAGRTADTDYLVAVQDGHVYAHTNSALEDNWEMADDKDKNLVRELKPRFERIGDLFFHNERRKCFVGDGSVSSFGYGGTIDNVTRTRNYPINCGKFVVLHNGKMLSGLQIKRKTVSDNAYWINDKENFLKSGNYSYVNRDGYFWLTTTSALPHGDTLDIMYTTDFKDSNSGTKDEYKNGDIYGNIDVIVENNKIKVSTIDWCLQSKCWFFTNYDSIRPYLPSTDRWDKYEAGHNNYGRRWQTGSGTGSSSLLDSPYYRGGFALFERPLTLDKPKRLLVCVPPWEGLPQLKPGDYADEKDSNGAYTDPPSDLTTFIDNRSGTVRWKESSSGTNHDGSSILSSVVPAGYFHLNGNFCHSDHDDGGEHMDDDDWGFSGFWRGWYRKRMFFNYEANRSRVREINRAAKDGRPFYMLVVRSADTTHEGLFGTSYNATTSGASLYGYGDDGSYRSASPTTAHSLIRIKEITNGFDGARSMSNYGTSQHDLQYKILKDGDDLWINNMVIIPYLEDCCSELVSNASYDIVILPPPGEGINIGLMGQNTYHPINDSSGTSSLGRREKDDEDKFKTLFWEKDWYAFAIAYVDEDDQEGPIYEYGDNKVYIDKYEYLTLGRFTVFGLYPEWVKYIRVYIKPAAADDDQWARYGDIDIKGGYRIKKIDDTKPESSQAFYGFPQWIKWTPYGDGDYNANGVGLTLQEACFPNDNSTLDYKWRFPAAMTLHQHDLKRPNMMTSQILNGFKPDDSTRIVGWQIHADLGNVRFVARCRDSSGGLRMDSVYCSGVFSPARKDVIRMESEITVGEGDGDSITGLATYKTNLLVFKKKKLFLYDVSDLRNPFEVENYEGRGIETDEGRECVVETPHGPCWVNQNGCFKFGDRDPEPPYEAIDDLTLGKVSQKRWREFITGNGLSPEGVYYASNEKAESTLAYDSQYDRLIIIAGASTDQDIKNYAVYDFKMKAWAFSKFAFPDWSEYWIQNWHASDSDGDPGNSWRQFVRSGHSNITNWKGHPTFLSGCVRGKALRLYDTSANTVTGEAIGIYTSDTTNDAASIDTMTWKLDGAHSDTASEQFLLKGAPLSHNSGNSMLPDIGAYVKWDDDAEICKVKSFDLLNNHIFMERGCAGTAVATHADNAVLHMLDYHYYRGLSWTWTYEPYPQRQVEYISPDFAFKDAGQKKKIYKVFLTWKNGQTASSTYFTPLKMYYATNGDQGTFKLADKYNAETINNKLLTTTTGGTNPFDTAQEEWINSEFKPDSGGDSLNKVNSFQIMIRDTNIERFIGSDDTSGYYGAGIRYGYNKGTAIFARNNYALGPELIAGSNPQEDSLYINTSATQVGDVFAQAQNGAYARKAWYALNDWGDTKSSSYGTLRLIGGSTGDTQTVAGFGHTGRWRKGGYEPIKAYGLQNTGSGSPAYMRQYLNGTNESSNYSIKDITGTGTITGTTTLTMSESNFSISDVGKSIGAVAGSGSIAAGTVIAGYTSATEVTLDKTGGNGTVTAVKMGQTATNTARSLGAVKKGNTYLLDVELLSAVDSVTDGGFMTSIAAVNQGDYPNNMWNTSLGAHVRITKGTNIAQTWKTWSIQAGCQFKTLFTAEHDDPYIWVFPSINEFTKNQSIAAFVKRISLKEVYNVVGTSFAINDMSVIYRSKSVR